MGLTRNEGICEYVDGPKEHWVVELAFVLAVTFISPLRGVVDFRS